MHLCIWGIDGFVPRLRHPTTELSALPEQRGKLRSTARKHSRQVPPSLPLSPTLTCGLIIPRTQPRIGERIERGWGMGEASLVGWKECSCGWGRGKRDREDKKGRQRRRGIKASQWDEGRGRRGRRSPWLDRGSSLRPEAKAHQTTLAQGNFREGKMCGASEAFTRKLCCAEGGRLRERGSERDC